VEILFEKAGRKNDIQKPLKMPGLAIGRSHFPAGVETMPTRMKKIAFNWLFF